jgi:uncharacterized protein with NAD-binding domain and iron-sulfur cluster
MTQSTEVSPRPTSRKRIAVLGSGMGALSAVYWLTSQAGWEEKYDITVYQLGWRLGGKATSGRQLCDFDRSIEHGYHVLLGFYQNVFNTMRQCYDELGRDSSSPLSTFCAATPELEKLEPWRYAVLRHTDLTIAQPFNDRVEFIPMDLPERGGLPGDDQAGLDPWDTLTRALDMLAGFATHARWAESGLPAVQVPRSAGLPGDLLQRIEKLALLIGGTAAAWLVGDHPLHAARAMAATLAERRTCDPVYHFLSGIIVDLIRLYMNVLWLALKDHIGSSWLAYLAWIVQDNATSVLCGLLEDDVLRKGFDHLDEENFIDWWMRHGTVPEGTKTTAASALATFPYDLVFGYRHGDSTSPPTPTKPYPGQPNMGAGTMMKGLFRFVLNYRGAPEWMFQAGCGEALVAPMYEVLGKRGVKFEFFCKVRGLHLDPTGKLVQSISLERQATLKQAPFRPLVDIKGIPCWPYEPDYDQLVEGHELKDRHIDLESYWTDWRGQDFTLTRGQDYDLVLLGISIGALGELTAELGAANPRWQAMLDSVETNRPFVLQVWFTPTLEQLGCSAGDINGDNFYQPFNLLTSMNQVIPREGWPAGGPQSLVYYSGVFPDDPRQPPPPDPAYPPTQQRALRQASVEFLEQRAAIYLPKLLGPQGFDWSSLQSVRCPSATGEKRLDAQHWAASINPTDRYVLSVAGSGKFRLAAGDSGFDNLYLAGDWTKIGFDAGCMEATFMSGMQASRAISGSPQHIPGEASWW